jgi:hypothetical protein
MKNIIGLLTAASMLSAPFSAFAENTDALITVSGWAYSAVSAFRDTGLMPEDMEDIKDYTQNITREQLCELVYSTISSSRAIDTASSVFIDTDNASVQALASVGIVNGVSESYFDPDAEITREAAAAIIFRALRYCTNDVSDNYELTPYEDEDEFSEWAVDPIYALTNKAIMIGSDNRFDPDGSFTIEQGIMTSYRLYQHIPSAKNIATDSVTGAADTETEYQIITFGNGYTETQAGDTLYISDGSQRLMSFGTDIFKTLDCVTRNGVTYVFASTHKGHTVYAYELSGGNLLYELPCDNIVLLRDEFIIVGNVATENGASPSEQEEKLGVYGYDGTQILPIEYSSSELRELGYYPKYGGSGFEMTDNHSSLTVSGHSSEASETSGNNSIAAPGTIVGSADSGESSSQLGSSDSSVGESASSGFGGKNLQGYVQLFKNKSDSLGMTFIGGCAPYSSDDGEAFISVEGFADLMDYSVSLGNDGKKVTVSFGNNTAEINYDSDSAYLNGDKVTLYRAPQIHDGKISISAVDIGTLFFFEVSSTAGDDTPTKIFLTGTESSVLPPDYR